MYVVLRIRGAGKMRADFKETLRMLRLNRKNHCAVFSDRKDVMGMVKKVKDWVTWGKVSDELLVDMIKKRGRKAGNKRLNGEEASAAFAELKSGKLTSIKPVFRLNPPSGGFKKSIKQQYPRGEVGYRDDKLDELLRRMI